MTVAGKASRPVISAMDALVLLILNMIDSSLWFVFTRYCTNQFMEGLTLI